MDDQNILAISWNIATEPKLYRELASNPYTQHAKQIIEKRFPDSSTADVIRAVILAEPEEKYDRNFRKLEALEQVEEICRQVDVSNERHARLHSYCEKLSKELSRLPRDVVYDSLSLVVFETADGKEIEQKYAQNQRRDFRLAIVTFIEKTTAIESIHKKSPPRKLFIQVGFAALSLIMLLFLTERQIQITLHAQRAKQQVLAITAQKANPGFPMRLKIPEINVDAIIEYVEFTPSGTMAVPNNTVDVGWFKLGPRPGEIGSAVIAGHFDGENGEAGVFNNLDKLKKGDKLTIQYTHGISISFVVRESQLYDPGQAAAVFAPNDNAHLNLITCDGVWDGKKKSYTKRLVVFTDMIH